MTKYEIYNNLDDLKTRTNPTKIVIVGQEVESYLAYMQGHEFAKVGIVLLESDNEALKKYCINK